MVYLQIWNIKLSQFPSWRCQTNMSFILGCSNYNAWKGAAVSILIFCLYLLIRFSIIILDRHDTLRKTIPNNGIHSRLQQFCEESKRVDMWHISLQGYPPLMHILTFNSKNVSLIMVCDQTIQYFIVVDDHNKFLRGLL